MKPYEILMELEKGKKLTCDNFIKDNHWQYAYLDKSHNTPRIYNGEHRAIETLSMSQIYNFAGWKEYMSEDLIKSYIKDTDLDINIILELIDSGYFSMDTVKKYKHLIKEWDGYKELETKQKLIKAIEKFKQDMKEVEDFATKLKVEQINEDFNEMLNLKRQHNIITTKIPVNKKDDITTPNPLTSKDIFMLGLLMTNDYFKKTQKEIEQELDSFIMGGYSGGYNFDEECADQLADLSDKIMSLFEQMQELINAQANKSGEMK